jgi:hypothetical protein
VSASSPHATVHAPQTAGCLEAIKTRHPNVHEDDVRRENRSNLERIEPVVRNANLATPRL